MALESVLIHLRLERIASYEIQVFDETNLLRANSFVISTRKIIHENDACEKVLSVSLLLFQSSIANHGKGVSSSRASKGQRCKY